MRRSQVLGLVAGLSLFAAGSAMAATSIAVQFLGRDGSPDQTGNPGVPPLNPSDVTGVVPQANWNPVDNAHAYSPANVGTTSFLLDNNALTTPVTLTFDCNDSWYNDVTPTNLTTPKAKMMNGIIKVSSGGGVPGTFTFTGVPEGQYDLYVYSDMNGDNVKVKYSDSDFLTSYYVTLQHQFYDTNSFVQGTNTDPKGTTNICNYVKFSNLGTYGRGSIGFVAQWLSGSDGLGIAGLQLVNVGPPAINTNPVAITTQPASRRVLAGDTNVTFSVVTQGPVFSYQWYTNGTAVPGETNSSILAPPIASTDNGTIYYVIVSNNVNNVKSANAVITVGQLVQIVGVQEKLWYGATRADVEAGSYDATPPDRQLALSSFGSPSEQGDNFAERLNCLFKPPVTTNYTFFITSDDDSDLFVSTDSTAANKRLVAQETAWSNPYTWVSDDGGGSVTQKRSDRYSPDAGVTFPFTNGILLNAGSTYYIEAVHHEGGGGDKVDVTFKIATEPDPVNGDASRITAFTTAPYPMGLDGGYIVVTNFPPSLSATQSLTATLTIGATSGYVGDTSSAAPGIAYQWQSAPAGSSTFANITGANGTSYTTPLLKLSDNGTQYRVAMIAGDASTNSSVATLNVLADTIPPRPVSITGVGATARTVVLTFSELMDKASTETPSGYVFNPGNIVATNVSLGSDGMTVTILTGTALPQNVTNVLTITGAKDLAGNLPAANTTISFSFQLLTYEADIRSDGPVAYFRFEEPAGTAVATNSGSSGIDGAYYTGDEASAGAGGVPSQASGDAGPQPPAFQGFPENNHSATFDGPAGTQRWVDARAQYLQHQAAFSLEYWVRPTNRVADPTSFGTRIGIVGQNDAIEYGFIDQNNIQIWTPNGGSLNTSYSFPDGEWHHVATIADGTSLKTYYDGVLKGSSSTTTSDYGNSTYNVHIGGGGVFDAAGNYFTGNIDEVAIFTKAIPAARIAEHYSAGKIGGSVIVNVGVTPVLPSGNGPTLTFAKSGNTLTISWAPAGGTLQTTTSLAGTIQWNDVGTANPATITIGSGNAFYRVKQ